MTPDPRVSNRRLSIRTVSPLLNGRGGECDTDSGQRARRWQRGWRSILDIYRPGGEHSTPRSSRFRHAVASACGLFIPGFLRLLAVHLNIPFFKEAVIVERVTLLQEQ
jgi:hypothetical protein